MVLVKVECLEDEVEGAAGFTSIFCLLHIFSNIMMLRAQMYQNDRKKLILR